MATLVNVVIQSAPAVCGSDEDGDREQADGGRRPHDHAALEVRAHEAQFAVLEIVTTRRRDR